MYDDLQQLTVHVKAWFLEKYARQHRCPTCHALQTVGVDNKVSLRARLCCEATGHVRSYPAARVAVDFGCVQPPVLRGRHCARHAPLPSAEECDGHSFAQKIMDWFWKASPHPCLLTRVMFAVRLCLLGANSIHVNLVAPLMLAAHATQGSMCELRLLTQRRPTNTVRWWTLTPHGIAAAYESFSRAGCSAALVVCSLWCCRAVLCATWRPVLGLNRQRKSTGCWQK